MEITNSLYESISSILLREYDENVTWNKLGKKIMDYFEDSVTGGPINPDRAEVIKLQILSNIRAADPTMNQQYSLWLATKLANKDVALECKIRKALAGLGTIEIERFPDGEPYSVHFTFTTKGA